MTESPTAAFERLIRGTYTNVPPPGAGLCQVCTAPTSGAQYELCLPCKGHQASPHKLAQGGVVLLSWAPMSSVNEYSAQGYADLRGYKEPSGTDAEALRLKVLMVLAIAKHRECLIPDYAERPCAVSYVPSTSGARPGVHPLETHFVSLFPPEWRRVTPTYMGQTGGSRNNRRILKPSNWMIDPADIEGVDRVLIIDDTWVTGSHVQSVGAAFERAGVAARLLILGRALDPGRTDQGSYLRAHKPAPFDSAICPLHRCSHEIADED